MKKLLSLSIIISSLILGYSIYAIQVKKQESLERQQNATLQEEVKTREAEAEQKEKEYISQRRNECYDIYEKEREKWNNVKDIIYSEERDICIVKYEADTLPKSETECEEIKESLSKTDDGWLKDVILNNYLDCKGNTFSKEF